MKTLIISLSDYGNSLGSRLHAKDIMAELDFNIQASEEVILDFKNISMMTLSFGTEIFDTLYTYEKKFKTINEGDFVKDVVMFCRNNLKKKNLIAH